MPSAALQALYEDDAERARELLAPDDQLDVFDAAAFGRVDRLRVLLAGDPSLATAFSDDGFTALHLAIYGRQEASVRALVDAGADLDAVSTGSIAQVAPIGTARFVEWPEAEQLLLDAGATPLD